MEGRRPPGSALPPGPARPPPPGIGAGASSRPLRAAPLEGARLRVQLELEAAQARLRRPLSVVAAPRGQYPGVGCEDAGGRLDDSAPGGLIAGAVPGAERRTHQRVREPVVPDRVLPL